MTGRVVMRRTLFALVPAVSTILLQAVPAWATWEVEREDEVVIDESTAGDLDVPGDLTAYETANL